MREIMTIPVDNLREKKVWFMININSDMSFIIPQAKGSADVCFISKVLDDYESMEDQDPEIEEDIRILGVVTFSGSSILVQRLTSKYE